MILPQRLQRVTSPLHPTIYAYTKGTGTVEYLTSLLNSAGQGKCTTVFLDLEKARALMRFQGHNSLPHYHEYGTSQGSAISPYLFNTLAKAFLEFPLPRSCEHITYADDITLVCTGRYHHTHSQRSLNLIDRRCHELGLKLNLNKSKAMAFGSPVPDTPLITAGTAVE
ncbi:hypothetical protein E2C01_097051 [Portunus trituberculatus]|uniref:Reverse transcriptase domain-containing protein n=1 Tax=Portunus trituberculatus TaxID=210409 RepID=A0A5B7K8Y0_PORTR|nr:hypothetical protein [Portunus trituberculatus]